MGRAIPTRCKKLLHLLCKHVRDILWLISININKEYMLYVTVELINLPLYHFSQKSMITDEVQKPIVGILKREFSVQRV